MKVVTTGAPRRRASDATSRSRPKRRTSTSTTITGRSAARIRSAISSTHSMSASGSTGLFGRRGCGSTCAATMWRGRRIGEEDLIAGHFAIDRGLAVDRSRLVVQQEAAHALARARRTGYHDDWRALRIGAGDRIDKIERTGPVGCDRNAEPKVIARRGIGGEADGRLMAQREVRENPALLDHLVERQHEIARNAEDLARAVLLQAQQKRFGKAGNVGLPSAGARASRPPFPTKDTGGTPALQASRPLQSFDHRP